MIHELREYQKLRKYPHLRPSDVAIWERFIDKYPEFFEKVSYDFTVGRGTNIPSDTQTNVARDIALLTRWRIDVVGFTKDKVFIIEVKPTGGANALGQALAYAKLYKDYIDPEVQVQPTVITDQLRPDVDMLAATLGVELFIV
mgnify:CR=1 FL=1